MSVDFYRAFEDRHRGSRDLIASRLEAYLPLVAPLAQMYTPAAAVDLGCGRGEWLELIARHGFLPQGVDLDEGMLAACTERSLPVIQGDAIAHLKSLDNESQCLVSGFHIAEHIAFDDLQMLVVHALRVLKPGGLLILETPNPENLVVGTSNFYLDPTHLRPIPPPLLSFLCEHYGFARVRILRLQESAELHERIDVKLIDVITGVSPDYAIAAQKAAAPEFMASFDAAFGANYGIELHELAERYDSTLERRTTCLAQRLINAERKAGGSSENLDRIGILHDRLLEACTQLVNKNAECERLQAEITSVSQRLADACLKAEQAKSESNQILMKINAIYASKSWRLTAPLRWIGSLISAIDRGSQVNFKSAPDGESIERSSDKVDLVLDMYVLGQGVKTGVYRVCDELYRRLAKRDEFNVRYLLRSSTHAASRDYLNAHDMCQKVISEDSTQPSRFFDLLFSPFGIAPQSWLNDRGLLQAHIIYDLIAIRRPDLFTPEAVSEVQGIMASLTANTLIFAISEYTKQDLLDYRPDLSPDQVVVIPLAAGEQFVPCGSPEMIAAVKQRYSIPTEVHYVLSLATLEVRKNLDRVVDAFAAHLNDHPDSDLHLVLAGMSGWKLESLGQSLSNAGRWRNRIIFTGFVEDCDLSAIYSGATCFVYLSQYEGFGLPPLEAMACGTPVICANNSSLPEVVGEAGILVNADDIQAAAQAIWKISQSAQLHADLSKKGIERASLFSWKRCEDIVTASILQFTASRRANRGPVAQSPGLLSGKSLLSQ